MSKTKVSNQSATTVNNTKKKSRKVIAGFRTLDGFIRRSVAASVLFIALCSFTNGDPCKAIKKDGTRCKQQIGLVDGYCAAHNPKANHCSYIKPNGERCKITVKATESRCRFHIGK